MTGYRLANLDWTTGGDRRLVRELSQNVDVLAVVEARNRAAMPVDLAAILGPAWHVVQDTSSDDRAGCAVAVRRASTVRVKRARWRLASRRGRDVQDRWLLTVRLVDRAMPLGQRRIRLGVVHAPIRSNARHDDALRAVARWAERARYWTDRTEGRWLLVGDFNDDVRRVAADVEAARHHTRDVMGMVLGRGWDPRFAHRRFDGSDHAVLTMWQHRPRKEHR